MSKKKVTLEQAKEILESDKVFYNGNKKFNVVDAGKYRSGITIEVPQEWTIDKKRNPESPIRYIDSRELTDGMNIDFDGDASFLLGNYRLSKNGKPVFELTEPTKAKDVLIKVSWGGAFSRTRGQYREYAEETGATFFTRRSSNGGGAGNDYWVLPVGFVKDMEFRDVSNILKNIQEKEDKRIEEIDNYIEREDLEIKASIANKDRILGQIQPIIEQIKIYYPEIQYEAEDDSFIYKEKSSYAFKMSRYSDVLVSKLNEVLEKAKSEKSARDKYLPMYQGMEAVLSSLNISIIYSDISVSLNAQISNFGYKSYSYSQEGYNKFINTLTEYQAQIAREEEEARQKAEELRKAAELNTRKEEAKKNGYPENFVFWNRLGGATNLGHAYVIEADGTIREPDYNSLRNSNHRYKYADWKNCADGYQGYMQILPGEIIVTYTKDYTAVPYIFDVAWADREITEAQLEVICSELDSKSFFAEDTDGKRISDVQEWVRSAVKAKSIECRKQLHLEEQDKEDEFVDEIMVLAEQKAKAKEKNEQAEKLASAYEDQLPKQKSLEDN